MKTKFTINSEIFSENDSLEKCFEYYEKYYKDEGWQLNKEDQEVFMIVDKEININEGDRTYIGEFRVVRWKCIDILNDMIEYALEQE